MIKEFDSRDYTFEIMDENDYPTDTYELCEILYKEDFCFFKEVFDETMVADIFLVEGTVRRWTGDLETETLIDSCTLSKFIECVGKDIEEIKLVLDTDKKILEYEGMHHDATNYFKVSLITKSMLKKELFRYAENSCDNLRETLLELSDNLYLSNCTKQDLLEVIQDNTEEL